MDFCKGINIAIVCKVFSFAGASAEVIKMKFEKYGGKAEIYSDKTDLSQTTHLVVPCRITKTALEKILNKKLDDIKCYIVNEEWAYNTLINKKLQKPSSYSWSETPSQPQKRKPQTISLPEKMPKIDLKLPSNRNFNYHLTKEIEKLRNLYEVLGDKGRFITYSNILRSLRLLPFKVESAKQLEGMENFGEKTLNKIKEILEKGTLERLKSFRKNERLQVMESLTKIHGIGNDLAYVLYKKKILTIPSLQDYALTHPEEFTKTQLVGIELYNEFSIKIPRDEVEDIAQVIKNQVLSYDKEALFEICGSYRRGRELCGDVDIVLGTNDSNLLYKVIENCAFITHIFSLSGHKFIGVGKAHDLHRRIDIYSVRPHEFWFSILYFTGSANYNRLLRSAAAKKGLHLSNTSLTYQSNNKLALSPNNENDIIHFLNFPILTLEERDI